MTLRYLLDTEICVDLRARQSKHIRHLDQHESGEFGMSAITHGELVYHALRSAQSETALAALARLTTLIPVLQLPVKAAEFYGRIRPEIMNKGARVNQNLLWIIAHALASDLVLVTNNDSFARVPGLKIENWAK